ncbi:MAG: ComEC/Rec2 family competence protein, partial [Bdellovibrionia bacterium]
MEQKLFTHPSMAVILGLSSLVLLLPHGELLKYLAEQTAPIHVLCLNLTPTGSYKPFYDAIVCGNSLAPERAAAFRSTGLIHLIVVSGAHLTFLLWFLERIFPKTPWPRYGLLVAFIMMTSWQPPALRGFAQIAASETSRKFGLGWSSQASCLISGVVIWAIFPELILSLSFLLSWAAALSISIAPVTGLKRHALVFLILVPVLAPLSAPHPASIFLNWIFVPLIGAILFPASLAATAAPPLAQLTDPLWAGLEWL